MKVILFAAAFVGFCVFVLPGCAPGRFQEARAPIEPDTPQKFTASLKLPEDAHPGDMPFIKVTLFSPVERSVTAHVDYRILPDEKWQTKCKKQLDLKAGETESFEYAFYFTELGTYVIRCRVVSDGERIADIEKALDIGKPSGTYIPEPKK